MKRVILVVISSILASGCVLSPNRIKVDEDGNIEEIQGKLATAMYLSNQGVYGLGEASAICQSATIQEVATLTASGQAEYYRSMDRCYSALTVAAARDNALSPQGEVSQSNARAIAASENASARKTGKIAGTIATLGIGAIVGGAIEKGFESAGHNTYNANNNQFSQSVNTSTAPGLSGEGELVSTPGSTIDASGTRTQGITFGNSNWGIQDDVQSSPIQVIDDAGEKPNQIEGPIDEFNDSDGNGNETSLF